MKKLVVIIACALVIGCALLFSGCIQKESGPGIQVGEGILRLDLTDKPSELDILHANVTISTVQVHKAAGTADEDEETNDEGTSSGGAFNVSANGPYTADVGADIQFLGSASDGEEPYNWSWDFGDGTTSFNQNPIHNYSAQDVFTVNLTVTDNTSAIAWDVTTATIGQEEENESESGWFTIINESQTFDLIALQNVTVLLGEKNLTAGKYTQIRLTVESAVITLNNSGEITEETLEIPSGKIKLTKPFTIVENETSILTLDFDVYKSVHKTGNDKYMMKPTIKIVEG